MDNTLVSQIMSNPAFTVHANERLDKALFLFHDHKISILPVVNTNGCCVGVLTLKDLVEKQNELIAECRARGCIVNEDASPRETDIPMSYFGDISVFEGMSANFHSVLEDSTVGDCIDSLLEHKIHHLPVLNSDQRLVGIVSTWDLIDHCRSFLNCQVGDPTTQSSSAKE